MRRDDLFDSFEYSIFMRFNEIKGFDKSTASKKRFVNICEKIETAELILGTSCIA